MTLPTLPPHFASPTPAPAALEPLELPQRPLLQLSVLPPPRPDVSRKAILVSLFAHLVLVLLAARMLSVGRPSAPASDDGSAGTVEGVEYVDITYYPGAGGPLSGSASAAEAPSAGAVPAAPGVAPAAPVVPGAAPSTVHGTPGAAPRPQTQPAGAPAGGGAPGGVGAVPGTATPGAAPSPGAGTGTAPSPGTGTGGRGGLRPGFGDPRLIPTAPKEVAEPTKTQHERYMEHLEARIDAINDSLGIAAARERKATDWTVKDKNGKRWGVSREGIHLGPVTLPPVILGGLPPIRGDATTEQGQRDQIKDQAGRAERDDSRAESIRRTRERIEKERAAARRDTTGGG